MRLEVETLGNLNLIAILTAVLPLLIILTGSRR